MTDYSGYGIPEGWQGAIVAPSGRLTLPDGTTVTQQLFHDILNAHGIWVVYVRGLRDFPCPRCRPDVGKPGEGDGDCPVCLGLGYRAKLERMRMFLSKGRRTMPVEADIIPGALGDSMFRGFFKVSDQPASHDYILEVSWNVSKENIGTAGEPIKIHRVYSLEQIEPFYFEGEPLYAMTTLDPFDVHLDPISKALTERRK